MSMVQDKIETQTKEVMEQLRDYMRPKGTPGFPLIPLFPSAVPDRLLQHLAV